MHPCHVCTGTGCLQLAAVCTTEPTSSGGLYTYVHISWRFLKGTKFVALIYGLSLQGYFHQRFTNGRGTGPGTAAHWEAQPPVVAQGAAAALRTRPLPQPTASSLVVESFCHQRAVHSPWQPRRPTVAKDAAGVLAV